MAKPPTSVRSIRLTDAAWALIGQQAEANKMSVNAWVALNLTLHAAAAQAWAPVAAPVEETPRKPKPFKSRLKGEWKAP